MGNSKKGRRTEGLSFARILENERNKKQIAERSMAPLFLDAMGGVSLEGETSAQADCARRLSGMRAVFLFPDAHPGKGIPVGASCVSQEVFHPHLAGGDIGCGVGVWRLSGLSRLSKEGLASLLERRRSLFDEERTLAPEELGDVFPRGASLVPGWRTMGFSSVGGGNHFVEIQRVFDARAEAPLSDGEFCLMVHTGSRRLGDRLAMTWTTAPEGGGAGDISSRFARDWLEAHDMALEWGRLNRAACAERVARILGADIEPVCDVWHNGIELVEPSTWPEWADPSKGPLFVHRKGASRVGDGILPLPSSRGERSFLLEPGSSEAFAWSCAHGAGRRWRRADCKARLEERFSLSELERPREGSIVLASNPELLWEEAPQAYKSGKAVLDALLGCGLARSALCGLEPLVTLK